MKVNFSDITRDETETRLDGTPVSERIKRNLLEVVDKKSFILGGYVEQFEKDFARYCGTEHCIGVANGLSALELSLIGLGIKPGDEVIAPANTFNATIGAIAKTAATPILVDADPNTYNINPIELKDKITSRTRAIMPVHLYGKTADMTTIIEVAAEDNLFVIEDACQAHGAFFEQDRSGSLGDAGCFSFYPGKNLGAYGDAGAVVTNNKVLASFLRQTRNYGQTKKYHHDVRPDNSRLDTIQAAVLVEKLKVLDIWNKMRQENAGIYMSHLKNMPEITLPANAKTGEHVYHLFVIQAENRDALEKHLEEKGVQNGKHYPVPINLQPCFSGLGYKKGDFPVSERLSERILSLPMFPTLRPEEIKYVADSIKDFYAKR